MSQDPTNSASLFVQFLVPLFGEGTYDIKARESISYEHKEYQENNHFRIVWTVSRPNIFSDNMNQAVKSPPDYASEDDSIEKWPDEILDKGVLLSYLS